MVADPSAGIAARAAACALWIGVFRDGASLDAAAEQSPAFGRLRGPDRGFAYACAASAIRAHGAIAHALSQWLARPLPDTAWQAQACLHIGAAQLALLSIAPHAAVSATVGVAAQIAPKFKALANAVLRKIAANPSAILAAPIEAWAPAWLLARWRAHYGAAATEAMLRAALTGAQPPIDLSVRNVGDSAHWAERLGAQILDGGSLRLPANPGLIVDLPGYQDGAWWVQDAAAALPAKLLRFDQGAEVADLCAAPGGKTLQLLARGAKVTALDSSPDRLKLLRQNLARCGGEAEIIAGDLSAWAPERRFDAVLLDAPCTATGTLRRNPEVIWRRTPNDIARMAALQRQFLRQAGARLKPGGSLVYAVCSLEPEEGEAVALSVDPDVGLSPDPIQREELPGLAAAITPDGALRTTPALWADRGGLDGFYIRRWRRL